MFNENTIHALLENITEGVILIDPDGTIIQVNRRIQSLLSLSENQLQNQRLDKLDASVIARLGFSEEELYMQLQQLHAGIGIETSEKYELVNPYRRSIRRSHTPVFERHGALAGLLMIFVDVTDIQDIRQTEDEIISMIVHDLKSPLSAVTSSMRLMREIADPNDSFGKIVLQTTDISGRALRKLLNLVNSMLDVTRMQNGIDALEREAADLQEIIGLVMGEFSTLADEMDIDLRYSVEDDLPLLDIDAEKVERILYNLMDNAIKFTPSDGAVTIQVDTADDDLREKGFVRVQVFDTGTGIPEDQREKIFNRFEQVKSTRRGTGLGLTFCKLAVEVHGGHIWIEDNPGGGSVFSFTLPIADLHDPTD